MKKSTREKRGKGVARKVSGGTKLPWNWMQFLRDSVNKEGLFAFLTNKVAEHNWPENKVIYITSGFCRDDIVVTILFIYNVEGKEALFSIICW